MLLVVGVINRDRVGKFKRTSRYTVDDFDLLVKVLQLPNRKLVTTTQVVAELSNLLDMQEPERGKARLLLKDMVESFLEPVVPSAKAMKEESFLRLGVTDAAIASVARERGCTF